MAHVCAALFAWYKNAILRLAPSEVECKPNEEEQSMIIWNFIHYSYNRFNFKLDPIHIEHQQADHYHVQRRISINFPYNLKHWCVLPPFPHNQSRVSPTASPFSPLFAPHLHDQGRVRSRTCIALTTAHSRTFLWMLMADAMVFEPSSMSECVQYSGDEGTGHDDGFAIAFIICSTSDMISTLNSNPDIFSLSLIFITNPSCLCFFK